MAGYTMNHPQFVSDLIDIEGFAQATVSSATSAAQSGALNEGVYDVWCDQDSYIAVGPTASTGLTSSTGYLLRQNNTVTLIVRLGSKIGAIMSSAVGTLYYHKVG